MEKWLLQYKNIDSIEKWLNLPQGIKHNVKYAFKMILPKDAKFRNLRTILRVLSTRHEMHACGDLEADEQPLEVLLQRDSKENMRCLDKYDAGKIKALSDYVVLISKNGSFKHLKKYIKDASNIRGEKMVDIYNAQHPTDVKTIKEKDVLDTDIRVDKDAYDYAYSLKTNSGFGIVNLRFFAGKKGGIRIDKFIKSVLKKKHNGISGQEILDQQYIVCTDSTAKTDKALKYMNIYVKMQYSEFRLLCTVCTLENIKRPDYRSIEEIMRTIGHGYGNYITFEGCSNIDKILKSLDGIKDQDLQKKMAMFYQRISGYNMDYGEALKVINKVDKLLVHAMHEKDTYSSILWLAMNSKCSELINDQWGIVLDTKTTKNTAKAICNIIGKHENFKYDSRLNRVKYDIIGNADIGGKTMKTLREIAAVKHIESVKTSINNGKVINSICLQLI